MASVVPAFVVPAFPEVVKEAMIETIKDLCSKYPIYGQACEFARFVVPAIQEKYSSHLEGIPEAVVKSKFYNFVYDFTIGARIDAQNVV